MDTTNKPLALTQADILGILQDANSVPLGQPISDSSEEYNKLKAIIESAIRYSHPVSPKYDPETGEPLIDGYPLFSGLPHPVKDKPHPKCDEACMYLCQMRELTDEEIVNLYKETEADNGGIREFARAILRKAQK